MNKDKDKLIRAIFSDYDGTLCSASTAKDTSLGQNRIPLEIKKGLQEIAEQIPICIISSKDYFFLKETRAFAKVLSCMMGIETLILLVIVAVLKKNINQFLQYAGGFCGRRRRRLTSLLNRMR